MRVYLFEDGFKVIDHRIGCIPFGLSCGGEYTLHLTKAAPLSLLFEAARMGMLVPSKDGGEGASVEYALECGIEEAGVAEVVETSPDCQLAHKLKQYYMW